MAISISDVAKVKIIKGTEGGDTYEVRMRGELDKKRVCYRPVDEVDDLDIKMRCANPAGAGTDHKGKGPCHLHSTDKMRAMSIKHGRNATVTRGSLAKRIDKYKEKDQGELLDLTAELSTMKGILEELVEEFPDPNDTSYGVKLDRVTKIISMINRLVDSISKIESRNAITVTQVIYLRAVLSDILMKYIEHPADQKRAAQELVQRVGGREEYPVVEM